MLTYTGLRNRYGVYTNNTSTANLANGDAYMNEATRLILGNRDWPFLEKTDTSQVTAASQQFYNLPYDYGKMFDVTVTVGSILYRPREVSNRMDWDKLNYAQNVTSNIPLYYFIYGKQCGFWPKPSSAGNQITYNYKKINKDLTLSDYTTGGIYSVSGTAVVGTATAWSVALNGQSIRITDSSSANGGDGYWYEIDSTTGTNTISLVKTYQGTTITANTSGASYTIGQIPFLPEQYQILPVYYAAAEYWRLNGNNIEKANEFQRRFEQMLGQFEEDYGSKSSDPMIDEGIWPKENINPNLTITLS